MEGWEGGETHLHLLFESALAHGLAPIGCGVVSHACWW